MQTVSGRDVARDASTHSHADCRIKMIAAKRSLLKPIR